MIEYTTSPSIKTVDSYDPLFKVSTGLTMAGRASIKINSKCPDELAQKILYALDQGWIEPLAHMTHEEYLMIKLGA
jgi:hypothetical protein